MNRSKAFITGAGSGIGKATAIRFAREGYDVCSNDINKESLTRLKQEMAEGDHLYIPGDFSDSKNIAHISSTIKNSWNHLDVLVNCAGISDRTDLMSMDLARWRKVFDIMIDGCLLTTKLAVSFMPDNGRIIHVSSIHANRAEQGAGSYSMAKAAINQFCRSMAVELASKNILVNAIAPGFVDTAMSMVDGVSELEGEWFRKNYIDGHHLPLQRAAKADEIAGVAYFFAGKDASYITGQVITVDGGLTITF